MTDLRKAEKRVFELLEIVQGDLRDATEILRQALAQPKQECIYPDCETGIGCDGPCGEKPVDTVNTSQERVDETAKCEHEPFIFVREDNERPFGGYEHCSEADAGAFPVYTEPPKREWKGLTSDDKHFLLANAWNKEQAFDGFMEAIDKFLEEKNT